MAEAKTTPKATVTIKVTRANGTEESYFCDAVTITDADAVTRLINEMPSVTSTVSLAEIEQRNADESKRNEEANRQAAQEGLR